MKFRWWGRVTGYLTRDGVDLPSLPGRSIRPPGSEGRKVRVCAWGAHPDLREPYEVAYQTYRSMATVAIVKVKRRRWFAKGLKVSGRHMLDRSERKRMNEMYASGDWRWHPDTQSLRMVAVLMVAPSHTKGRIRSWT